MAQVGFSANSISGQLATPQSWEQAYRCGTIRSKLPGKGFRCDLCSRQAMHPTPRYRCLQCEDYDSCSFCIADVSSKHFYGHNFVKIEDSLYEEQPIHAGVQCDACHHVIQGIRYKCHQCPDYDLCQPCLTNGYAQAHSPTHTFAEIRHPMRAQTAPASLTLPSNALAPVSSHGTGASHWDHPDTPPQPRWQKIPATAFSPEMIVIPKTDVPPAMRTIATCAFCSQKIMGDRYKCMQCPNIDACGSCFKLHPHTFLRMSATPTDICISFANAPTQTTPAPAAHNAYCDGCKKTIVGIRYKCSQCPDFDLCSSCESNNVYHPLSHAFLQIKTPAQTPPTSPPAYTGFAATSPTTPPTYTGFASTPPVNSPMAISPRPGQAQFFGPQITSPNYAAQPAVDPAQRRHNQRVAIADNLNIVNSLMSVGMTLFGGGN